MKYCRVEKDLIIAGAGIPGICTAVQAARMGLKVALINSRSYIGGNGNAELMICVSGATGTQEFNYNARETGVIEELLLENLKKNPMGSRYIWDSVLMDFVLCEDNIELFSNTYIDEVVMGDDKKIISLKGTQNTTETRYEFCAPIFVDDTGDGTVSYLSGAEYRYGRESKAEFGERIAPDKADKCVIPSTMVFYAKDVGKPVAYQAPKFALDLTKTDILKYRVIPPNAFDQFHWFYEIDGQLDQIYKAEETIQHHRNLVYGIWDYIKNSGEFASENYDLEYVSPIPGKRESRRIMGDYVLKESDIVNQTDFPDTVGYGGWSIDLHAIDGFYAKEPINKHVFIKGIYQIPYRCGYSKDISNLFIEGRCMSTTHVAFGTTRVIATLSTIAQANAVAAFLCKKYKATPREIYEYHLEELQNLLLKNDQFIIGRKYLDNENLAADADVIVSSEKALEQIKADYEMNLDKNIGLSVPVMSDFKGISLLVKNEEDTHLIYRIYKPSKNENYGPDILLCERHIKLDKSDDFRWVTLPAKLKTESIHCFIEITSNPKVTLAASYDRYTGVMTSIKKPVDNDTLLDVDTLDKKDALWCRADGTLCFKMEVDEHIFGGHNLTNGFTRPYMLPNIWHSNGVENEFFSLHWTEQKKISKLMLYFDSDLDFYYCNNSEYDFRAMPTLVKDYDIYVKDSSDAFYLAAEIRNNYQRVNEINISSVTTDEIKVVFHATNGQPFVSVYGVRVYE